MRDKRYAAYELKHVKTHLGYEPETGLFRWLMDRKRVKAGEIAGTKDKDGYVIIAYNGKLHKAHRLAWFFVHGKLPEQTIDHENRIRSDNRISNLRLATQLQQMHNINMHKNNKSGFNGVFWSKRSKKWQAQICIKGERYHVGLFDDAEEASTRRHEMKLSLIKSLSISLPL
ncbi:HNH endonuclease [Enterobacteriaceae bacterium RIT711]|nr:HNH endonuclease [Enterobacteriaceae bacterium RIT711]